MSKEATQRARLVNHSATHASTIIILGFQVTSQKSKLQNRKNL